MVLKLPQATKRALWRLSNNGSSGRSPSFSVKINNHGKISSSSFISDICTGRNTFCSISEAISPPALIMQSFRLSLWPGLSASVVPGSPVNNALFVLIVNAKHCPVVLAASSLASSSTEKIPLESVSSLLESHGAYLIL